MDQVIYSRRRSKLYLTSSIALAIIISVSAVVYGVQGQSAQAATPPDSCFAFDAGSGTITDYYDHEGNNAANPACPRDVDIPSTIGGVAVTAIGNAAFFNKGLTGVTIPNSVTVIESAAFLSNKLAAIAIPNSVTSIGVFTFSRNDLTSVTIPSSVTTIGVRAFQDNQLESVLFNGSVASLGTDIFENNLPLSSITYGGVEYTSSATINQACFAASGGTISDYRLYDMNLIKNSGIGCLSHEVAIPSTLGGTTITNIGDAAFGNNDLTYVDIPGTITRIGNSAFSKNRLSNVVIPDSVTEIGDGAFSQNQLMTVDIGQGVITIGDSAFIRSRLATLTLPDSVTSIGDRAFYGSSLTTVTIPGNVITIGRGAFSHNNLTTVTLSEGVVSIGDSAFSVNRITTVTIPDSVTSIDEEAFAYNSMSTAYVGRGVASLPPNTFAYAIDYSQWEGGLNDWYNDYYSGDVAQAKKALSGLLLTKVYTSSVSNPQNLENSIVFEGGVELDGDGDWNEVVAVGGHLVNPSSLTLNYRSATKQTLQASRMFAGQKTDGTYITSYYLSDLPAFTAPADPDNITPEEEQSIDTAMTAYYRIGDTVTITPPAVQGYITPPSQTFTLASVTNDETIVYAAAESNGSASPSGDDEKLAATGANLLAIVAGTLTMIAIGATLLIVARRRKKLL